MTTDRKMSEVPLSPTHVEIVMEAGLVQSVNAPQGVTVTIYDYDVEGTSMPIQVDPDGDEFIEFVHEGQGDWD